MGVHPWWWKLHWSLWKNFRGLDITKVVAERGGDHPGEYSYGETPVLSACKLLKLASLKPESKVLDLGCGRGLLVLTAALLGYRAAGIELVSDYLTGTRKVAQELAIEVELQEADMLEVDWPQADLVFLNSTAFPTDFRAKVLERVGRLPAGVLVATYDWALPEQSFDMLNAVRLPVSWGIVFCRLYRRT